MTESRAAGISALPLVVAPLGASVQTGLVIGCRRDGGRGVSVAFLGGGSLGLRQAHGSLLSKSKTRRQRYQQNAQHKAHDGVSLRSYSFNVQLSPGMPALQRDAPRKHLSQATLYLFEFTDQIREDDRAIAGHCLSSLASAGTFFHFKRKTFHNSERSSDWCNVRFWPGCVKKRCQQSSARNKRMETCRLGDSFTPKRHSA